MLEMFMNEVELWAREDLLPEAMEAVTAAMEASDPAEQRARVLVAVACLRRWIVEG
jgi:hypothetical protein